MHHTGVKHQAADALLSLKTKGEDNTILDDEVLVPNIPQDVFTCALRTDITDLGFKEELKGPFVLFIPEVCLVAAITDNGKAEITSLAESISAQSTDAARCSAFASVGKSNTCFNVNSDGMLVRVSPFYSS